MNSQEHEDAIQEIWTKVIEGCGDDRYGQNQCKKLLSDWHPILLKRAEDAAEKSESDSNIEIFFERECSVAEELLSDIQNALMCYVTDERQEPNLNEGILWYVLSHENINTQPDYWRHVSPVKESELKRTTASYLEKPWLQHNFIDWAIINASLFNQVAELSDGLKSGQLLGKTNWGYLFAGNKLEKRLLWEGGLALFGFLIRWVIPPAVVIALQAINYEKTATTLAVMWAVYVFFRFVGLIAGWGERKALRVQAQKYLEMLDALIAVWLFTNSEVINPTRLRELLVETDQRGIGFVVPAVVYSLVDRAIERDPAVLAHSVR